MGNCCSSSSERDPFSQPGRPLGTTPAAPTSASVPPTAGKPSAPRKVGGPPRTLGGSSTTTPGAGGDGDDARRRAADAAEARLQKSQAGGGKLRTQLAQQRAMTDAAALKQASENERRQRDLDQSTAALNHS